MPVMDVRLVRVLVDQRFVPVEMRMRLRHGRIVPVLVVLVVDVEMLVLERFVHVLVGMLLGSEQRDARRHQDRCDELAQSRRFPENGPGEERADERSRGEDRGLARRAQVP